MRELLIKSHQGDYPVEFIDGVEEVVEKVLKIDRAAVAVDRRVAELYEAPLGPILSNPSTLLLDATEDEKTLAGVGRVLDWLQGLNATKQTVLVVFGGGIVQDICSFSAHVYYRGIKWVLAPTTLLSMSDSAIGAKCCINLNAYKNQLGVFHSPARVLTCTRFTDTLSDLDVASGYGEIFKLMYTGSADHLDRLTRAVDAGGLRNPELPLLVREALEVKKAVIEEDEYETGLRRTLNYGHTFGHALEAVTGHEVPHGQAVAWGMDLVNYISVQSGLMSERDFLHVHELIRRHLRFPLRQEVSAAQLIAAARRDKKVADGQINLVLAEGPGKLRVVKRPFDATLEKWVADYIEGHNVFARE